jgi:hypothetical protein
MFYASVIVVFMHNNCITCTLWEIAEIGGQSRGAECKQNGISALLSEKMTSFHKAPNEKRLILLR